ncbi:MAG TPA: type II toxin-antitoxin system VapB family antitoxin [Actinomycetota bacterium]
MARMLRTNIVIDEDLVGKVMERFALPSKRAAIDFALHAVLGEETGTITDPWRAALELEGIWSDMTDEEARAIWGDEVPDGPNARRPAEGRRP